MKIMHSARSSENVQTGCVENISLVGFVQFLPQVSVIHSFIHSILFYFLVGGRKQ